MEWEQILDILTPANLADLGNPDYSLLADCLGKNVFNEYQVPKINENLIEKIENFIL